MSTLSCAGPTPGRSANPSAPDSRLWVGPQALRWLRESPAHVLKPLAGTVIEGRLAPGTIPMVRSGRAVSRPV